MQIAFMLHILLLMHVPNFLSSTIGIVFNLFDTHHVLADITKMSLAFENKLIVVRTKIRITNG
jgi:type III secretory pathway component EscS